MKKTALITMAVIAGAALSGCGTAEDPLGMDNQDPTERVEQPEPVEQPTGVQALSLPSDCTLNYLNAGNSKWTATGKPIVNTGGEHVDDVVVVAEIMRNGTVVGVEDLGPFTVNAERSTMNVGVPLDRTWPIDPSLDSCRLTLAESGAPPAIGWRTSAAAASEPSEMEATDEVGASSAFYPVLGDGAVRIREAPYRTAGVIGSVPTGDAVKVVCTAQGDPVQQDNGIDNRQWNYITSPLVGWVPDAFTDVGGVVAPQPVCDEIPEPAPVAPEDAVAAETGDVAGSSPATGPSISAGAQHFLDNFGEFVTPEICYEVNSLNRYIVFSNINVAVIYQGGRGYSDKHLAEAFNAAC